MASRVDCSAFHLRHVLFFSHQYVTIRDWIVGAIHSGFRLLAVCLFSYNPSFSYLSLCDCKATTLCYNNGLGRDDKRRTVDSFVVNKTLRQPRNRVTNWSIFQLLTDHWLVPAWHEHKDKQTPQKWNLLLQNPLVLVLLVNILLMLNVTAVLLWLLIHPGLCILDLTAETVSVLAFFLLFPLFGLGLLG